MDKKSILAFSVTPAEKMGNDGPDGLPNAA